MATNTIEWFQATNPETNYQYYTFISAFEFSTIAFAFLETITISKLEYYGERGFQFRHFALGAKLLLHSEVLFLLNINGI